MPSTRGDVTRRLLQLLGLKAPTKEQIAAMWAALEEVVAEEQA